jgi:hypothetical protein
MFVPALCLSTFAVCIAFAIIEDAEAWPKVGRVLLYLLQVGRWKVVCSTCHGTGLCKGRRKNAASFMQACNGRCDSITVERASVPTDFVGGTISFMQPSEGRDTTFVVVGSGWYYGSFWAMLWYGWWKRKV